MVHNIQIPVVNDLQADIKIKNYKGMSNDNKFGFNEAVGTSWETIWDGEDLYPWPTAASILTISSDAATDTAAGVGAQQVKIYGLDANYNLIDETIELNGTTPVSTTLEYYRVYRMKITRVGSSGYQVGNIYAGTGTVTLGVPAVILAKILDSTEKNGQTLMTLYTVPAGYRLVVFSWGGNVGKGFDIHLHFMARALGEAWQVKDNLILYQQAINVPLPVPFVFDEKTDIEVRGHTSVASVSAGAKFSFMLIDKELFHLE